MSNVYKNSQKHEARKYVGISWNSNLKLACEINCDLVHYTLDLEMTLYATRKFVSVWGQKIETKGFFREIMEVV